MKLNMKLLMKPSYEEILSRRRTAKYWTLYGEKREARGKPVVFLFTRRACEEKLTQRAPRRENSAFPNDRYVNLPFQSKAGYGSGAVNLQELGRGRVMNLEPEFIYHFTYFWVISLYKRRFSGH
jgi:hypothetical protein